MSCHQNGDAMVLRPGKDYRDFKPGMPLDDTLAIFMVPPRRDSPQTDLLEHYFSMTLSKCYRGSAGRLSCITCHDPHVEPAKQEAPAQFRAKCLECHNEKSCALPAATRQRKTPPDDCAGCHMPKRQVQTIAHAVLTNHRIVAQAEEPYPDAAFQLASPQTPDLVHLTAIPSRARQCGFTALALASLRTADDSESGVSWKILRSCKATRVKQSKQCRRTRSSRGPCARTEGRSYGDPIS